MELYKLQIILQIFLIGTSLTGFCKTSPAVSGTDKTGTTQDNDYDYDENVSEQNNIPKENTDNLRQQPYLQKTEYKKKVKTGKKIDLECLVKNLDNSNVVFWMNGTTYLTQNQYVLANDPRLHLETKYYTLTIDNIKPGDANVYSCVILPQNLTMKANLEIIQDPVARIYAEDGREITGRALTFHEGEQVHVICNSTGNAPAKIKWFADGEEVRSDGNIEIQNGHLVINKLDNSHVRLYQCLADHGGNVAHATVNINIQYVPRVTAHRSIVNTKENGKAELHCSYESFTSANVLWQKNGRTVFSDASKVKFTIASELKADNKNVSILTIYNINQDDLGDYQCVVENPMGTERATIHLTYSPEPPVLEKWEVINQTIITHWRIHSLQPLTEIKFNYQLKGTQNKTTVKSIDHERSKEHFGVWKIKHQFEVVDGGVWQVRIQAKNELDWSTFSEEKSIPVTAKKLGTGAASRHSLSTFVCCLTMLLAIIPKYSQ